MYHTVINSGGLTHSWGDMPDPEDPNRSFFRLTVVRGLARGGSEGACSLPRMTQRPRKSAYRKVGQSDKSSPRLHLVKQQSQQFVILFIFIAFKR